MHPFLSSRDGTVLVIIDIQEKFAPVIAGFDAMATRAGFIAAGCGVMSVPVIVTEQYPKGLGSTVAAVRERVRGFTPVEKLSFSCTGCDAFSAKLGALGRNNVVLCGVETHVCVNQTALSLLEAGYRVQVAVDAVGSRMRTDHETALRRMERAGAVLTTAETCLFEMVGRAEGDAFKAIRNLIKQYT